MEVNRIYPSEFIQLDERFQQSQLTGPFYGSHSQGRSAFLAGIKAGTSWQLTVETELFYLVAVQKDQQLQVTDFLQFPLAGSWRKYLQILENFARQRFVKELALIFLPGTSLEHWLVNQGYRATENGFVKTLSYHTALVFGGGGARGAYQIGVWQALNELEIDFKLITGTSVGALNGGLVLNGDVEKAKELWETLSTDQVLQFPAAAADNTRLTELLRTVGSLTTTALREKGTSSEPLYQLMEKNIRPEKVAQSSYELITCATRFPDLAEIDRPFDKQNLKASLPWLIASASFFPAMKPAEIDGELYIDGGYRNNLPVDVAIKAGGRECIAVNVKGPGFIKKITLPPTIALVTFDSPWTLGSFLVFATGRSSINYQLGYFETLKYFERLVGFWYTLPAKTDFQPEWRRFCRYLQKEHPAEWQSIKNDSFWQKLRKVYQRKVVFETAGLALTELIGKQFNLPPDRLYTKSEFITSLLEPLKETIPLEGALSVSEWLQLYREKIFLLSEARQFHFFLQLYQQQKVSGNLFELAPIPATMAHFLLFLEGKQHE